MAAPDPSTLDLHIRVAAPADLAFILTLLPRLVALELPPGREASAILASSEAMLKEALSGRPSRDSAVLVAETAAGGAGFIHLERERDFFSGAPLGYIANLAVARQAEGRGVGAALIGAAEAWTRGQGCRYLTLYVFASNSAARGFYRRCGFVEDSLKLVKDLAPANPDHEDPDREDPDPPSQPQEEPPLPG